MKQETKSCSTVNWSWTEHAHSAEKNLNKTGTSQVGALSKAQKYSRNNYWKHLEKTIFFNKIIWLKNRTMPKNPKRGHLGSLKFFTNLKLQKNARGYPLIKFENFRKKSHSAEKNPKGILWSNLYFWKHKKIYGLVRESNPRSPGSENWSKLNK